MKIGFLLPDLTMSGGSNVLLEHATGLVNRGHEVIVIDCKHQNEKSVWHPSQGQLRIETVDEARIHSFDIVLATWWRTVFELWKLNSKIYGYFNQSLESRLTTNAQLKFLNRVTYSLPLFFITEARWLADFIRMVQPGTDLSLVGNGLSRKNFPLVDQVSHRPRDATLRVLVEGSAHAPTKAISETFELLKTASPRLNLQVGWLTSSSQGIRPTLPWGPVRLHERIPINAVHKILREYDVLLKLSRVEGVFGPPLEMFSQGGTAITAVVTGSEEYMRHGHNGLLVEPYNQGQIIRYLELLDTNRDYLTFLRRNALATAVAYPDWDASTDKLESELLRVFASGRDDSALRPALVGLSMLRGQELAPLWVKEGADTWAKEYDRREVALVQKFRKMRTAVRQVKTSLRRVLKKEA